MLRETSGVYLIARPLRKDRISVEDILYIGLVGGNVAAEGTFFQRVRSHAGKLKRGDLEPGCPQAWAQYHQECGGMEALHHHALRLIVMPARTQEDKANIKRLEDFLLLVWRLARDQQQPDIPRLNAKTPDLRSMSALFEGALEDAIDNDEGEPEPWNELFVQPEELEGNGVPVDVVGGIWPNEDEQMEQAERMAKYQIFFADRGYQQTWATLTNSAIQHGIGLRVISMKSLIDRGIPGELRIATMLPGGTRAKQVHAILIPESSGHQTKVELRLPLTQLPEPFAALAEPYTRGKMQSRLRLPTARLPEVVQLFA